LLPGAAGPQSTLSRQHHAAGKTRKITQFVIHDFVVAIEAAPPHVTASRNPPFMTWQISPRTEERTAADCSCGLQHAIRADRNLNPCETFMTQS
jgi:hypothetical protein